MSFSVRFPELSAVLEQNEEFFFLRTKDGERKILLPDYATIYNIPNLYEHVCTLLRISSQTVVASIIAECVKSLGISPDHYSVLDIAAGSGMLGDALHARGLKDIVGIDILEEAKTVALRDHPGVYSAYYVDDIGTPTATTTQALDAKKFSCIACCSAMDFNHVPFESFIAAYNRWLSVGGLCVFNIRASSVKGSNRDIILAALAEYERQGQLTIQTKQLYTHRISIQGVPIDYLAIAVLRSDASQLRLE